MLLSIGNPTPSAQDQRAEAPVSYAPEAPEMPENGKITSTKSRAIGSMKNVLLRYGNVVTAEGERQADIHWNEGVVRYEWGHGRDADALNVHRKKIFPGFIDPHTHLRTPGLEHKGNMETEALSALMGGVTTICDKPNTIPPTLTIDALRYKVDRAVNSVVDIRFFFGMTKPEHLDEFRRLMTAQDETSKRIRAGMCGVKIFLEHSTGNLKLEPGMIDAVFQICAEFDVLLEAHCEDPEINAAAERAYGKTTDVRAHSIIRPPESEAKSIAEQIDRVRKYKTRFHVVHVSTWQGIDLIRAAKTEGLPITCEVVTHNIFATTNDYDTLGTHIKMNPPIRPEEHLEGLWKGIQDGTVNLIATDHAPHTIEEKSNPNPMEAPSGVPGVETRIPLLLSVAADHWPHPTSARPEPARLTYLDIHRLCFAEPNRIFRLGKNDLTDGAKADVVIVDPDKEWIIKAENLHSKCGWTPYEGWTVKGSIERVLRA